MLHFISLIDFMRLWLSRHFNKNIKQPVSSASGGGAKMSKKIKIFIAHIVRFGVRWFSHHKVCKHAKNINVIVVVIKKKTERVWKCQSIKIKKKKWLWKYLQWFATDEVDFYWLLKSFFIFHLAARDFWSLESKKTD